MSKTMKLIFVGVAVFVAYYLYKKAQETNDGTEESVGIGGRRRRRKRDKWANKLCRFCRNNPQGCNAPACQGAVECGCS